MRGNFYVVNQALCTSKNFCDTKADARSVSIFLYKLHYYISLDKTFTIMYVVVHYKRSWATW